MDYYCVYKILIVGDPQTGKSNVFHRFINSSFHPDYQPTKGLNWGCRVLSIQYTSSKIIVWDSDPSLIISSQDSSFSNSLSPYYQQVSGAFIVYDITNPQLLENYHRYVENIRIFCGDIPIILLGNKVDLLSISPSFYPSLSLMASSKTTNYSSNSNLSIDEENIKIYLTAAHNFCSAQGLTFFPISCRDNWNIEPAFYHLLAKISSNPQNNDSTASIFSCCTSCFPSCFKSGLIRFEETDKKNMNYILHHLSLLSTSPTLPDSSEPLSTSLHSDPSIKNEIDTLSVPLLSDQSVTINPVPPLNPLILSETNSLFNPLLSDQSPSNHLPPHQKQTIIEPPPVSTIQHSTHTYPIDPVISPSSPPKTEHQWDNLSRVKREDYQKRRRSNYSFNRVQAAQSLLVEFENEEKKQNQLLEKCPPTSTYAILSYRKRLDHIQDIQRQKENINRSLDLNSAIIDEILSSHTQDDDNSNSLLSQSHSHIE